MQSSADKNVQIVNQIKQLQLAGHHTEALAVIDRTITASEPGRAAELQLLQSISYIATSRFRKATRTLLSLLSLSIENKVKDITLECFYYFAEILYLQNNFTEAEELLKSIHMAYASPQHKIVLAKCTCLLGEVVRVYNYGSNRIINEEALPLVQKAQAEFNELGCKEGVAEALSTLGLIYMNLDDNRGSVYYQKAENCLRESHALFSELNNRTKAAWQEYNIGALFAQYGDRDQGTALILKSAKHMHETGNTLGLAWHYYSLAHINADMFLQRDQVSISYYQKTFDLFDQVRNEIAGTTALNSSFFEEVSDAYQRYAHLLTENNSTLTESSFELLFNLVERSKANMLLRQLSSEPIHVDPLQSRSFQTFSRQSDEHKKIADVIGLFLLNAVDTSDTKKHLERIPLKTFQRQILKEQEVFVSFYCAVETILCLIITPDSFRLEKIEGWKECCETIVTFSANAIDNVKSITDFDTTAEQLEEIFHPVLEAIRHLGNNIIVSPDVQISHIPFDSLPNNKNYPLLGKEISTIHSASVLTKLRTTRVANNGIPFKMYIDIATMAPMPDITTAKQVCRSQFSAICNAQASCTSTNDCSNLVVGSNVSDVQNFLATASEYLHIMCHGTNGDQTNDFQSALELGPQKELLTANMLSSMVIPAKLIVLSVCKSAGGRTIRGEGIDSICNAFFAAGAQCVIAALWPIFDQDAIKFNELLLSQLLLMPIGKAFAHAKNEAVQSKSIRNTFQWAPFVLYGNSEIQLWR